MRILTTHALECINKKKNVLKFYTITVEKEGNKYLVYARWGRIGNKGTRACKGNFATLSAANCAARVLRRQKIGKGYKQSSDPANKEVKKVSKPKVPRQMSLDRFSAILE